MSASEQAKVYIDKANDYAKLAWLHIVGFLKSLRAGTRQISFFMSPRAFGYMTVGLVLVTLALIIRFVATKPEALVGLAQVSGSLFSIAVFVLIGFSVLCAGYLSLTANWDRYIIWWLERSARKADRKSSVTTSLRLARKYFSNTQGRGFFLTMAPALRFPKLPAQKLNFDDDRHVTMIAGSRAGKGRAFIIPNLAHWQGSAIIYDPSGENFHATAAYRQKVLGQKIILLDPFKVTDHPSDTWNPMSEIDFDNDPFAMDKCYLLAESIHHQQTPDPYWTNAPRKMLAMCSAYVGTRSIAEHCHLGSVRDLLMTADPQALWLAMSRSDAYGGIIRRFGESNEHRSNDELNSTMEITRTAMKWLDSPIMSDFVKTSTFSMREIKEGKLSIYVVLPAGIGETYRAWLRLLFNAAFEAMQDMSTPKPEHDTLFLMDEFPLLGKMERFKRAAGEAAKFGVKLFICAQDVSQLKEHYGIAWETFIANSGVLIMFGNNDLESQQYLSARLGKHKVRKMSFTSGGESSSTTTSYELEDVARPDQLEKIVSRQAGDAYFFIAGRKPMCLPRANYDQWSMIDEGLVCQPLNHDIEDVTPKSVAAE